MEKERKDNQLIKLVIILIAILFFVLITIAVIQTFAISNLEGKLKDIKDENTQTLKQIDKTEQEIEIRESAEYVDEFLEKEGYGKEGEIIIKKN